MEICLFLLTRRVGCGLGVAVLPDWLVVAVQMLSPVQRFVTPWTISWNLLSFTISWSLLKLMSVGLVLQSNHLILCHLLLLLPSVFPSISVFSNELALHIRWPTYWSFSFSITPSSVNTHGCSVKSDSLATLWVIAHQAPLSMGFSKQEY